MFSIFSDNGLTKTQKEPAQRKRRKSLFGTRVGNHRLAFRCRQISRFPVLPPASHASPGSPPGSSRRWQPEPPACTRSLLTASRPGCGKAVSRRPRHPKPQAPRLPETAQRQAPAGARVRMLWRDVTIPAPEVVTLYPAPTWRLPAPWGTPCFCFTSNVSLGGVGGTMDGPGFTASLVVSAGQGWVAAWEPWPLLCLGASFRVCAVVCPRVTGAWSRGKPGGTKKTCFQSQAGLARISE